ncbi:MAG: hypothetical protein K2N05_11335 [Muribaculaceae bacterium]|nr:hypothetical protein [Muribaculaceae bacterium]
MKKFIITLHPLTTPSPSPEVEGSYEAKARYLRDNPAPKITNHVFQNNYPSICASHFLIINQLKEIAKKFIKNLLFFRTFLLSLCLLWQKDNKNTEN